MQKSVLGIAALTALRVSGAIASADTVETVVVTATRTEQRAEKTGASLSLIVSDELKTQQIIVLSDILKQVPSIIVTRSGDIGQTTTVAIRGAEQGQTVTVIDGIRINDPSDVSEGTVFADVLSNNISRIEILRGPQSTLYGGDAIGGVINIITRRGGDTPIAIDVSAEGGSFGTRHASVAANGADGDLEYGAAVNYFTRNGISAADSRNGNTEPDGYRNFGASINMRIHLSETVSADARGYYTSGHVRFDDNFNPLTFVVADSAANNANALKALYFGLNGDLFGERFRNRVALIATSSARQYFDSAFDSIHLNFDAFGNAVRLEYQGIVDFDPDTQLTFGAETQESSFRSDGFSSFAPPTTAIGRDRLTGYYADLQATLFERLTLTGGIRLDDDQTFGTHVSFKFNGAWQIPQWGATVRANIGNGFEAPSLFQEFGPNSNPLPDPLKPETATGWEIGFDENAWDDRLRSSVTYFDRRTNDQIGFQNCFTPLDAPGCPSRVTVFGYYINIDRTRARGVEASVAARLSDSLRASLNWTSMSASNLLTGKELARRPRNLASATLTWQPLPGGTLGASMTYQGKRFNDAGNLTPLSANATINLFGNYELSAKWQVYARIDNLFNDRTEQVTGFGVPGISAFGGIRTSF